jgi:hypothetical protein
VLRYFIDDHESNKREFIMVGYRFTMSYLDNFDKGIAISKAIITVLEALISILKLLSLK